MSEDPNLLKGDLPCYIPIGLQRIDVFLCPSDVSEFGNNYRVCSGALDLSAPDGAFGYKNGQPIKFSDIHDGLSNTVAVSEKIKSPLSEDWNPLTDVWYTGLWSGPGQDIPSGDQLQEVCAKLNSKPLAWQTWTGYTWLIASGTFTEYNHIATPNLRTPDCTIYAGGPGEHTMPSAATLGSQKATSYHAGGVNVMYLDGHLSFVSDNVDKFVWWEMATRGNVQK